VDLALGTDHDSPLISRTKKKPSMEGSPSSFLSHAASLCSISAFQYTTPPFCSLFAPIALEKAAFIEGFGGESMVMYDPFPTLSPL